MQLVPGSDRSGVSAWWFGEIQFTLPWSDFRRVDTFAPAAAVEAAASLCGGPKLVDSRWRAIEFGAFVVGLTATEFAARLGVVCDVPYPVRTRGFWIPSA